MSMLLCGCCKGEEGEGRTVVEGFRKDGVVRLRSVGGGVVVVGVAIVSCGRRRTGDFELYSNYRNLCE